VLYAGLPLATVFLLFNITLIAMQAASVREGLNLFGAFGAGFGLASVIYGWLMRKAIRESSDMWSGAIRDIVKTTLTRLQEVGAIHPDFDISRMPGNVVDTVGVGFEIAPRREMAPPGRKLN
jgi:hypothetical protein